MNNWLNLLIKQPKKAWLISVIWLLLISWVAFFAGLGNIGLIDKTEALYVEVAHQIILTNNWIIPHWNGEPFYSYPIGGYWFMALSFKIFGVSEWAARFPVALSAMAVLFLCFYTLRYLGISHKKDQNNQQKLWLTAWLGAGIIALNPAWVAWGRTGVSDMLLASNVAISMLAFFLGYAQPDNQKAQKFWYIIFPIFMAIATLVKGPLGILLPVLGIGSFLIYLGKLWQVFWEINPIRTMIIFFLITLPWYIAASITDDKFVNEFLGFSNFQRFTNVLYNHPGPWYFYIIWITILMLPWSIYFPKAMANLYFWQIKHIKNSPRFTHLGIFCFFWFSTTFVFFSAAATKLPGYILPLIPSIAIIITLFWSEKMMENKPDQTKAWFFIISAILNIIILIALTIGSGYSATLAEGDSSSPNFGNALREAKLPLILATIWGIASLSSIFLLLKKTLWRWLWLPNLFGFLALLALVLPPLIPIFDTEKQQPFRELSTLIKQEIKPNEEVFLIGFTRYSVVYYSEHKVEFLHGIENARDYLKNFDISKDNDSTVLILTEQKFIDKFELNPQDYELINKKGAYQLIRVLKKNLL